MKEYYRIDEVAEIFDVNRRTVERLIAHKELPAVKVRGCTRIHRSDLEGFRTQQKNRDPMRQHPTRCDSAHLPSRRQKV